MSVANSQEVKEAVVTVRNRRTDAMFVVAVSMIVWIIYLVCYTKDIGEYAQGVLTLVLGMFVRELSSMYQYETGSTRSAQAKDTTIKNLAEGKTNGEPKVTAAPVNPETGNVPAMEVVHVDYAAMTDAELMVELEKRKIARLGATREEMIKMLETTK